MQIQITNKNIIIFNKIKKISVLMQDMIGIALRTFDMESVVLI